MSLESTNILPKSTKIERVINIIEWLGYIAFENDLDIPKFRKSYFWNGDKDFKSFVGIELYICENKGIISINTRTRAGRSYWDLQQQNKTIQTLKDFFGGSFTTDEGKNILFQDDETEPTLLESGLYLQKWQYHNDVRRLQVLRMNAQIAGAPNPTGIPWMDDMNAKIIFNNLHIPYLVGVWEKYLKSTFVVLLKCSSEREKSFKKILNKIKILPQYMETLSQNGETVEWILAEWLSFQRPKSIIDNFQMIDGTIEIQSALMKPTPNQTESLLDRIDHIIEIRNGISHAGIVDTNISDSVINECIEDFIEAADRIYHCLGDYYHLHLREDY